MKRVTIATNVKEVKRIQEQINEEEDKKIKDLQQRLDAISKERQRMAQQNNYLREEIKAKNKDIDELIREITNLYKFLEEQNLNKKKIGEEAIKQMEQLVKIQQLQAQLNIEATMRYLLPFIDLLNV